MIKPLLAYDVYPNRYLIDEYGNVFDTYYNNAQVPFYDFKWYYCINLQDNTNHQKSYRVHRLVLITFSLCRYVGYDVVNHKDLDKHNNNPNNLEWTTNQGNTRHAIQNHARQLVEGEVEPMYDGTGPHAGECNGRQGVLTQEQVYQICQYMVDSVPYTEILERMGLPQDKHYLDILTKIRSKKLWYCISKNYDIPNKEYRSPATNYTEDEVRTVCEMIVNGNNVLEMAEAFGIDPKDYKKMDCFRHFVKRIKDKKTFNKISDEYF